MKKYAVFSSHHRAASIPLRINAYDAPFGPTRWAATFSDMTPTELVTAFTTALAAAHAQGRDAFLHGPDHSPLGAVEPLLVQD
ncbi:DUF317 domain-containing protein [Streptomyces cinnamoneus]|uniref:DUF317 domain-containing protein n=1 Tax=Streptomyces cinnamoneus TaxID=53446 RepID=UPI001E59C9CC|nr:DUF317 domain-containing protein [Streptomyces cinnamoneus]